MREASLPEGGVVARRSRAANAGPRADSSARASAREPRVCVVVITQNVQDRIAECLESVGWADDIVVVDSHSTDATRQICRQYTDKIYQRTYHYAADQKNFGIQQAIGEYVLVLDADERVTEGLAREIRRVLGGPAPADVYCIPRRLIIHGRWIRFGGEYPKARPRLFRNGVASYRNQRAHAPLQYDCRDELLNGDVLHYSYGSLADLFKRVNTFSTRRAQDLVESGRTIRWYHFLWAGGSFLHRYLLRGGFRDGVLGFFYCAAMSLYVLALYAKAWYAQHPLTPVPTTPRDAVTEREPRWR